MPSCSVIDLAEIRRSSKITSWIWSIISGVVTVLDRPGRGASQVEKSPRWNWATRFLTTAHDGACSPNVFLRMAWISFCGLSCRKKKPWWQLASRCCWNRARRLTCFFQPLLQEKNCNSAHKQTHLFNNTIDSVLRHREVDRATDLSAAPHVTRIAVLYTNYNSQQDFGTRKVYCVSNVPFHAESKYAIKTFPSPTGFVQWPFKLLIFRNFWYFHQWFFYAWTNILNGFEQRVVTYNLPLSYL